MDNDRFYAVISKLSDYVKSPSLQHVRNPHSLQKLAREIIQSLDRAGSLWAKGDGILKIGQKLGVGTSVVQRVFKQEPWQS